MTIESELQLDSTLVQRARAGDTTAFTRLVLKYEQDTLAASIGILRNRADAEDAAQEAFLRAWSGLRGLREPDRFKSWMAGIVYRVCQERMKDRSRTGKGPTDVHSSPQTIEVDSKSRESQEIMNLPKEHMTILSLFYFHDLSIEDLSDLLNISKANAKVRLHRARRVLRERLEVIGEDPHAKS